MLNNILAQRITSFKNKEYMNLKIPILGTFRSKIEILSTYNLLCQKFKAVCWKTLTFCPNHFLTPTTDHKSSKFFSQSGASEYNLIWMMYMYKKWKLTVPLYFGPPCTTSYDGGGEKWHSAREGRVDGRMEIRSIASCPALHPWWPPRTVPAPSRPSNATLPLDPAEMPTHADELL